MKNNKRCPKCSSTDIIEIPGKVGPFGTGNNISAGMTIFTSVKVTRFLCEKCGFSEEWVGPEKDLKKLKKEYKSP